MTGDDEGGPTSLLATKLHPPTRRPVTVARPRLIERVARGRQPVLTVVAAPAGFGKTTSVAEWFAAPGDPTRRAVLDAAERVYDTDLSPPVRPVAAVKARVQIAAGDVSAARRWAITNGLGPDDELAYVREYEHLTLARALLAEPASGRDDPSTDQAMRLLARLLDAADEGLRHGSAIEALVLRSLGHEAQGDRAAALRALERAVARAMPEGNRRVFIDDLPALAPLLRAADLAGAEAAFVREVLAASPDRIGPMTRARPPASSRS